MGPSTRSRMRRALTSVVLLFMLLLAVMPAGAKKRRKKKRKAAAAKWVTADSCVPGAPQVCGEPAEEWLTEVPQRGLHVLHIRASAVQTSATKMGVKERIAERKRKLGGVRAEAAVAAARATPAASCPEFYLDVHVDGMDKLRAPERPAGFPSKNGGADRFKWGPAPPRLHFVYTWRWAE